MPVIPVHLEPNDYEQAARVGLARYVDSMKRKSADSRGFFGNEDQRRSANIDGVLYEYAFAVVTNTHFRGTV